MEREKSWIAEQRLVGACDASFWIAELSEFDRPNEEFLDRHSGSPVRDGLWVAKEPITFLKTHAPYIPFIENGEWYLFWIDHPQLSWTRCFLMQQPGEALLFLPILEALLGGDD